MLLRVAFLLTGHPEAVDMAPVDLPLIIDTLHRAADYKVSPTVRLCNQRAPVIFRIGSMDMRCKAGNQQGCGQSGPDMEIVHRTLISLGCNPNLAGVLLISLGCEGPADHILEGIAASGKPVSKIVIQEIGGASNALKEGSRLARRMVTDA